MALIHYVVCSDFGEGKEGAVKAAAWLRKKYNIKRRSRYIREKFRNGKPTVCFVEVCDDGSAVTSSYAYVREENLSWINLCKHSLLSRARFVQLYTDRNMLGEL